MSSKVVKVVDILIVDCPQTLGLMPHLWHRKQQPLRAMKTTQATLSGHSSPIQVPETRKESSLTLAARSSLVIPAGCCVGGELVNHPPSPDVPFYRTQWPAWVCNPLTFVIYINKNTNLKTIGKMNA